MTFAVALGCQSGPDSENTTSSDEASVTVPSDGKAAYVNNGCAQCHSVQTQDIEATISSEQMRGPDLSQIGSEHDADWIVAYVKREQAVDGEQHRVPYAGNDDDLRAVADWLVQPQ
ncbi:MAG: c-type cytochrome [Acidobacteria bacterium]|nr:c-type cytochrome [Acidobacteriota bacterium]MDA1237222.1 c-type cytochrome [Acidobacteriota bacterium]